MKKIFRNQQRRRKSDPICAEDLLVLCHWSAIDTKIEANTNNSAPMLIIFYKPKYCKFSAHQPLKQFILIFTHLI